ncbi:MAG: hypothetical protein AAF251_05140 [Pseudomonadota bacterium]
MIKVERPAKPPASLARKYRKDGKNELERVIAHIIDNDGSPKGFEYSRYKSSDVKTELENLFHGKCAYCETPYGTNQPLDVEHFRPKGQVQGIEHEGYWWLAMAWDNLLPSCIDCNRRRGQQVFVPEEAETGAFVSGNAGKKDIFPIAQGQTHARINPAGLSENELLEHISDPAAIKAEEEARLLLDPTRDDPAEHLQFRVTSHQVLSANARADASSGTLLTEGYKSWVIPREDASGTPSSKGEASISVYGLNRLGLLQARARVLLQLELLLAIYVDVCALEDMMTPRPAGMNAAIAEQFFAITGRLRGRIECEITDMQAPSAPYSAAVRAWVKQYFASIPQN